ncbi:uncharacterized protein LOC106064756 isoform X1 [Biomphalaria glabrata]|uniref:Uncharacterized protein LOC106064756 isoform X1 n=2 Tax=Biomphalaria glabrata TaxID=6526 RepID=A0A9W2ZLW1_BIOGL|nr:uncharacterized protein LOC106064756 isoform X1 [Biomphalaria glabrata]
MRNRYFRNEREAENYYFFKDGYLLIFLIYLAYFSHSGGLFVKWLGINNMDLDTANSIEVITVSTISTPGTSGKKVVPLQIGYKFPLIDNAETGKLRRPVRPIDRQRMRPWLMELLDLGNVFGLKWTNRHQGVFQISWRHASRLGWNLETDGDVFERWARHTGIYREGDPPEPKRWKANFRCALHSLHDVVELTSALERKGRNACRTYRFLHSSDQQSIFRKKAKSRKAKEQCEKSYEKIACDEPQTGPMDSASSEECVSESESDWSHEDKVIVQKLNVKMEIPEEEYGLHHDHDYSAGPDKTQKTIVLRQGVGSIMLHKEILSAPDDPESDKSLLISNLDQLASAAMSSAGMDEAQVLNDKKDKKVIGQKVETDLVDNISLVIDIPDAKLHCLPSDKFDKTNIARKRKVSSDESMLDFSSGTKKGSKKKPLNIVSSTLPSTVSVLRSGSPKILCRRSKRNSSKNDKSAEPTEILVTTSASTEPLMSSCLLLLEAATRLDNAEKNGRSGHSQTDNSSQEEVEVEIAETLKVSSEGDAQIDNPGNETHGPATPIRRLFIKQGTQIKTVENLQSNWKQTVFKEATVGTPIPSEGKLVVSEAKGLFSGSCINSTIKGLFSGSSIKPNAEAKVIMKGKTKDLIQTQPTKNKYFAMPRCGDAEQKFLEESATVPDTTVKATSDKHVVIERNLKPAALQTTRTSEIPLVLENSSSLKDAFKEQENSDRKLHGQPLVAANNTSQGALFQANVYSILSSLNNSEASGPNANSKILITSPLPSNTLTLSPVAGLNTPVLLNTSYNFQSQTQPDGQGNSLGAGLGKSHALVMCGVGKDTLNDLKLHVVPVSVGKVPSLQSHTSISTSSTTMTQNNISSSLSSPAFINTHANSTLLLLPSISSVQAKVKPEPHPAACPVPHAQLLNVDNEKAQALPVSLGVKCLTNQSDSKQVLVMRSNREDEVKQEMTYESDCGQVNADITSSVKVESLDICKESKDLTNPGASSSSTCCSSQAINCKQVVETQILKTEDVGSTHNSGDKVKPLSEICKRYLSQLFSTLDNQSSESEDSDSVSDVPRQDQDHSQTSVNCTVEYFVGDTCIQFEVSQQSHASELESLESDELSDLTPSVILHN